jgi:hypothetical protein
VKIGHNGGCVIDNEVLSATCDGSGRLVRHPAQLHSEAARASVARVGPLAAKGAGRFGPPQSQACVDLA